MQFNVSVFQQPEINAPDTKSILPHVNGTYNVKATRLNMYIEHVDQPRVKASYICTALTRSLADSPLKNILTTIPK